MPSTLRLLAVLILAAPAWADPPQKWLDFGLAAETLPKACASSKSKAQKRLADLALTPPDAADFRSSFLALSDVVSDLSDETSIPQFMAHVSSQKPVRDAGLACDTDISTFFVDVFTREDLYKVLKAGEKNGGAQDPEDKRLVEKTLMDFRRNGLELPAEVRSKVKDLKQRMVAVQNDYQKTLGEWKETVSFSRAQLEGLPEDFIERLPKDGEKLKVSLDYPDYFPFMENAKDPEARRALEAKFNMRGGPENIKRLEEVLKLRAQAAKLLGYPTHAHYVLEDRMAKTPEEAQRFLQRLKARLREKAYPELAVLLALKREEQSDKTDGVIRAWDWRYYHNKLLKTRYQVDDQKIKEYFPMDVVTAGMLEVYQLLLGVKFSEVKPNRAWHEDVRLFEVSDSKDGKVLSYFFMDLFPREGKYKHAAAFTLIPGRLMKDGSYQKPVSAMVANFNKPTKKAPSLLTHGEVETFFHEFGHIMHQTLTSAKYERFSGTSVARDFVEAPSQMLENWVWQPTILERLSGHYKDRSKKLPKEILDKMLAAKTVDSGLKYLRQAFFGAFDFACHTDEGLDTTSAWAELTRDVALIPKTPGTYPQASFGHLMGGYDASYYGYAWSEVYAQDMFSRFEKEGLLNPEVGRQYRRIILEPGGKVEEGVSLRTFLGREPSEEAFYRNIGLVP